MQPDSLQQAAQAAALKLVPWLGCRQEQEQLGSAAGTAVWLLLALKDPGLVHPDNLLDSLLPVLRGLLVERRRVGVALGLLASMLRSRTCRGRVGRDSLLMGALARAAGCRRQEGEGGQEGAQAEELLLMLRKEGCDPYLYHKKIIEEQREERQKEHKKRKETEANRRLVLQ